jgi:hypothetical protein
MEFEFDTEIEELEVTIRFDYQPEEPVVMYYPDGSGDPGCSAAIDSYNVTYERDMSDYNRITKKTRRWTETFDITDIVEKLGFDIEHLCFEHVNSQGE